MTERMDPQRLLTVVEVDLCVITMGRPEWLGELLASFARLRLDGFRPRVLVVDNDPMESAWEVVEAFKKRVSFEVVYDVESRRGISQARNCVLRNLKAPYFSFVDDDETVSEDWLVVMYSVMSQYDADVVFGPARELHEGGTPTWMGGCEIQYLLGGGGKRPTGMQVPEGATNNVLVRTRVLGNPRAGFDPAFDLTGGGDAEFFRRLGRAGAKMIWCEEGYVCERIPSERMTWQWLCRRAFRNGQGFARVVLAGFGNLKRMAWYAKKSLHLVIGFVLLPCVWLISRVMFVRLLCKICSTFGHFSVLFGKRAFYEEYSSKHYRSRVR
jgi:succinoglycan biosynthesis protein ExoM